MLKIQHYTPEPLSLDQAIGNEGDSQLGDFIEDFQAMVAIDAVSFTLLQDQLQSALATLSEREASIIRLRYGLTDGQRARSPKSAPSTGSPENASDRSKQRR